MVFEDSAYEICIHYHFQDPVKVSLCACFISRPKFSKMLTIWAQILPHLTYYPFCI